MTTASVTTRTRRSRRNEPDKATDKGAEIAAPPDSRAISHPAGSPSTVIVTATAVEEPAPINLDDPAFYMNRELSLLEFQRRVLEEAQDQSNRLIERLQIL